MSAPKFREGDIVRHDDHNFEGRVRRVTSDGIDIEFETGEKTTFAKFVHGERLRGNPCFVTVLRRPVRVGDVLVLGGASFRVDRINDDTFEENSADGIRCLQRRAAIRYGWTHADGVPIDGVPNEGSRPKVSNGSFAEMVDAIHPADAPKNCQECSAFIEQLRRADDRADTQFARANALSDIAGELRTERDELLRENATLRRRVEDLEARDRAERTAKGFAPKTMMRVRTPR